MLEDNDRMFLENEDKYSIVNIYEANRPDYIIYTVLYSMYESTTDIWCNGMTLCQPRFPNIPVEAIGVLDATPSTPSSMTSAEAVAVLIPPTIADPT